MRQEFTGMIPGAIAKFEELFVALDGAGLNPKIVGCYSSHGGDDDLRTWGVVCDMKCDDAERLATEAATLGIQILDGDSLAYTNGLTLADFKTCRVAADLTLQIDAEEGNNA